MRLAPFLTLLAASVAFAAPPCPAGMGSPIVKYASSCPGDPAGGPFNGWNYESKAEGPDNDDPSSCPKLESGAVLTCTGFSVCDPAGLEVITSVKVAVRGKVGNTSASMKIVVGAASNSFNHTSYNTWEEVDVTSQKAWTWDDIQKINAKATWASGSNTQLAYVDAFKVTVAWTPCIPAAPVCGGDGLPHGMDSCGNDLGALVATCDDLGTCSDDYCSGGGCVHPPKNCDDGNGCTNDGCDGGGCWHSPTKNVQKVCSGEDVWWQDSCGGLGDKVEECDDGNGCTDDVCSPGGCLHTKKTTPECCQPYVGYMCESNKLYKLDSCQKQGPLVDACDDGDACTIDSCDAGLGQCTHLLDAGKPSCVCEKTTYTKCLDNNVVLFDGCNNQKGIQQACDDGNPCTTDGCDPDAIACTHAASNVPPCGCDEGSKMVCQGNAVVVTDLCGNVKSVKEPCDDGDGCTYDACDQGTTSCTHTPNAGPPCVCTNVEKLCKDNQLFWKDDCGNTTVVADGCDDGNKCTVDGCSQGACTHTPSNDPGCVCVPAGTACQGNAVVAIDSCGNQTAVVGDCNDLQDCTIDTCEDGVCNHTPVTAPPCNCQPTGDTACSANALVQKDTCGNVIASTSCDDGDACTLDVCNPDTVACEHTSTGETESFKVCDGNALMWVDECGNVDHLAEVCEDTDPCTIDTCDESLLACVFIAKAGAKVEQVCEGGQLVWIDSCGETVEVVDACDDGDGCTTDGCDQAACTHTPKSCEDDGEVCTDDLCKAGECVHPKKDLLECLDCKPFQGTICDGNAIVWLDGCNQPGAVALSCDDGNACTTDGCDPKTVHCIHIKSTAAECKDAPDPADCTGASSTKCDGNHLLFVDACGVPAGVSDACMDGDPCTTDSCVAGACSAATDESMPGCDTPCSEGEKSIACHGKDLVWVDGCGKPTGETAKECSDGDDCTEDGCDTATDQCTFTPAEDCPGPGDDVAHTPPDAEGGADASGTEPGSDVGTSGDATSGDDLGKVGAPPIVDSDGCAAGGGAGSPWALLLVAFGLVALRRRSAVSPG